MKKEIKVIHFEKNKNLLEFLQRSRLGLLHFLMKKKVRTTINGDFQKTRTQFTGIKKRPVIT